MRPRQNVAMFAKVPDLLLPQLSELYAGAFSEPPWNERWTIQAATEELSRELVDLYCCCFFMSEKCIGFGTTQPMNCYDDRQRLCEMGASQSALYVRELVTGKEARRQGVCSAILYHFSSLARSLGYSQIVLRTRVDNQALLRPLLSNAWLEVGRYEATTGGARSERIVLAKDV